MTIDSMPFAVPPNAASSATVGPQPTSGWVNLVGLSVAETAGTATRLEVRDQGSATGNVVAAFQIPANGSLSPNELPGVKVNGGLYLKVVGGGTLVGSVYIH
jgi:hypothetical protein